MYYNESLITTWLIDCYNKTVSSIIWELKGDMIVPIVDLILLQNDREKFKEYLRKHC